MTDTPKLIHAMVRIRDEARSLAFYRAAFGLEIVDRLDFDGFTLIYLANAASGFELELTVNKSQSEAYDLGNGYGHLAVSVADLDAAHERMRSEGLSPGDLKELAHASGFKARFFFISDPDGYKIEVLQRGGRFQ